MSYSRELVEKCGNFEAYARGYFKYLADLMDKLDINVIRAFVDEVISAQKDDNTIFVAGNGGSAATASHMANEFGVDVLKKGKWSKLFKVLSLTDNNSVMTAIANNDGYENLFVNQLKIHFRKGDKLVAISASGNSSNVVKAAKWVKEHGGNVIGLTGFDGGKLKSICDIAINVETPKGDYGPVEDIHMIIDHLIDVWLQNYGVK